MNLSNYKKVYIHSGNFNVDDVISMALIKIVNPTIEIVRTNYINQENEFELLVGIGNCKISYNRKPYVSDYYGNLLSLSSLVWESVADDILNMYHIKNIDDAFDKFYHKLIKKIIYTVRNNYDISNSFPENKILLSFNSIIGNPDENFIEAVEVGKIIIENVLRKIVEEVEYESIENEIWQKAKINSSNGIYILEQYIPWQNHLSKNKEENDVKVVIFKSNRSGYNVISGDSETFKISDCEHLSFCHPSGFMGIADDLNQAIKAANYSIANA